MESGELGWRCFQCCWLCRKTKLHESLAPLMSAPLGCTVSRFANAHAYDQPGPVPSPVSTSSLACTTFTSAYRHFTVDGDTGCLSFQLPELSVAAKFRRRVPWSEKAPNSAGPEGWLERTGLLPLHYFVVSHCPSAGVAMRLFGDLLCVTSISTTSCCGQFTR